MGNCLGSSTSRDIPTQTHYKREKDHGDVVLQKFNREQEDLELDLLVKVYRENLEGWRSVSKSFQPVSLLCDKKGVKHSYKLLTIGKHGTSFYTHIHLPGTNFRKTSTCFLQWRDEIGGTWGLQFQSESDTDEFLERCSPKTSFLSSLTPEPPTINKETFRLHSLAKLEMNTDNEQPFGTVSAVSHQKHLSLNSYDGVDSDEYAPLFEPASPRRTSSIDFILTDIKEECEDVSTVPSETTENEKFQHKENCCKVTPLHDCDMDLDETTSNRSDSIIPTGTNMLEKSKKLDSEKPHDHLPELPLWPISPPPGHLLSPRYSMVLSELEETNRFSVTVDDELPPLPLTLPPGNVVLPGQSEENSELNLSILLSRVATQYEGEKFLHNQGSDSHFSLPKINHIVTEQPPVHFSANEQLKREEISSSLITEGCTDEAKQFMKNLSDSPEKFSDRCELECTHLNKLQYDSSCPVQEDNGVFANGESGSQSATIGTTAHSQGNKTRVSEKKSQIPLLCKELLYRKAGWLQAKHVLVCENKKSCKVKGRWRKYWVVLNELSLLLYECDHGGSFFEKDAQVSFLLNLDLCLVNAANDCFRRDCVFSVATGNGNVFYFQATSQDEVGGWTTALHSAAAAFVTGKTCREECLRNLESKLKDLNVTIGMVLKKTETALRAPCEREEHAQTNIYSEAIELLNVDQYRLQCYIASLIPNEQPNPEVVLSCATKQSKMDLMNLEMFSPSTLTALVNAKHGLISSSTAYIPTSVGSFSTTKKQASQRSLRAMEISDPLPIIKPTLLPDPYFNTIKEGKESTSDITDTVCVHLPNGESTKITLTKDMTFNEFGWSVCKRHQLNKDSHFVRLTLPTSDGALVVIPYEDDTVNLEYSSIDVCQKSVHTVVIESKEKSHGFGLEVTPVWTENESDLKCVTITKVNKEQYKDLNVGDEIIKVDDISVKDLDMSAVKDFLESASTISLTVRTCILNLHWPHNEVLPGNLGYSKQVLSKCSRYARAWMLEVQPSGESFQLKKSQKLLKGAFDLYETEVEYVKSLEILVENYLRPLQEGSILSKEEIEVLCGDIIHIVKAQQELLSSLKASVCYLEKSKKNAHEEAALKTMVRKIATEFLSKQDHFRRYSTFCASHQKSKELIDRKEDHQLCSFLEAANPQHDPLWNLCSLLTRPIVRISRYPLFLSAIMENTEDTTEEKELISEAFQNMCAVASYINEMQRICETYQTLFESLTVSNIDQGVLVRLKISELKYQAKAIWLNSTKETYKRGLKKGQGPVLTIFVFDTAIVLLHSEKRQGAKGFTEDFEANEVGFKAILPCVHCQVQDLPNSDGVSNMWLINFVPMADDAVSMFLFRNDNFQDKLQLFNWIKCVTTDH